MSRRRTKYLEVLVATLILIGGVIWVITWAGTPRQATIVKSVSSKSAITTYYDNSLDGTYMSFKYSGKYIVRKDGPKDNYLELYTLSADTHYDKRILASVANLPDGRLQSDGGYIFRQKSPALYNSKSIQLGDASATIWVKKDGSEQTAMVPRGNKLAVISMVTASTSDNIDKEMEALLNTFKWK
jgi:hypothetical protein